MQCAARAVIWFGIAGLACNPPGNPVSQSGVPVTASIQSGPGGTTLGGTTTVNTDSSGTASFSNLSLNRSGTFKLRFRSGDLQQAVSNSILIP